MVIENLFNNNEILKLFLKSKIDPIRCGYTEMCLAKENSSHLIKIDPDRLTVANEGVKLE